MQKGYFYNAKRVLLQCKKGTFADQKGYFCNAKRVLLQCKKGTFVDQKGYFCNVRIMVPTNKKYRKNVQIC